MTEGRGLLILTLVLLGAGWGISQPLSKIAVGAGYRPYGIIFWQLAISGLVLGVNLRLRGRPLPMEWRHIRVYMIIALIGTILPNTASYTAIAHIPSGMASILLSVVPMVAFPVALALGNDSFSWRRLGGLLVGLCGVLLIVLPTALPSVQGLNSGMTVWLLVALIAPAFYAFEGNFVARWGTAGLGPIQTLCGASLVGVFIALPIAVLSGAWITPFQPIGGPEAAIIGSSIVHAFVYSGYVWLVGRAGPSFAAQVSYLVTGFGVMWAMLILSESYPATVWAAMGIMFIGIFLVQPRRKTALAPDAPAPETGTAQGR